MSRPFAFSFVARAPSVTAGNSVKSEPVDAVASILVKQSNALGDLNILSRKSVSLSQSLKEVGEEISRLILAQNDLCERELFDEAETLNAALLDFRRKQDKLTTEISRIPKSVYSVRQELADLARQLTEASTKSVCDLQKQSAQLEAEKVHADSEAELLKEKLEAERKITAAENDRLANQEEEVKARRESLDVRVNSVSTKVETATVTLREKRINLLHARDETDARISELELQLKKELEHRESQNLEISSLDREIKSVEMKYAPELAQFDAEKNSVESAERELNLRKKLLLKDFAQIESRQNQLKADKVKREDHEVWLKDQVDKMSSISSVSGEVAKMRSQLLKDLASSGGTVQSAQESAEAINEDLMALTACIEEKEEEIVVLKAKLSEARDKLPVLEGQKKVAIQARAFKEAKDITDEIKLFTDQMHALDASAATIRAELTSLREALTEKTSLQQSAAITLMKATTSVDAAQKDILSEYVVHLKKLSIDKHVEAMISPEIETCQTTLSDTMERLGIRQAISADPLSITSVSSLELPESTEASPDPKASVE